MGGGTAPIYAQNFDAVLVVIVISAGDAIFAKFHEKLVKRSKLHILTYRTCRFFQDTRFFEVWLRQRRARARPGPWAHGPMGPLGPIGPIGPMTRIYLYYHILS